MRCWGNKNWVPTPYLNPLPNPTPAAEAKVGMFVVQETWTNVGAVVGDKVTRSIMTPIFVRETGCFKNRLIPLHAVQQGKLNSNLCGFFYPTYY